MKVKQGFTSTVPGLDHRRKTLGLSKAEVARRVGVTRGLIGQYISGKADPPAEKVTKLAEALECSTDLILYPPKEAQAKVTVPVSVPATLCAIAPPERVDDSTACGGGGAQQMPELNTS